MHASLFHTAIQQKDKTAHEILEAIEPLKPGLFSVLEDAFHEQVLKPVLLYIILAYSKESHMLVMGANIKNLRARVAEHVNLPDKQYDNVVKLKDDTVREVTLNYLEFQGDRPFRHLMRKYDLYEALCDEQMRLISREDEDGKDELNMKALVDSSKLTDSLMEDIGKLEDEIIKRDFSFVFENLNVLREETGDKTKIRSLAIEEHAGVRH